MTNKKKKILIDLERLRYPNSGIANVFKNLALGISKLSPLNNISVSLYGPLITIDELGTNFKIKQRVPVHKFRPFSTFKFDLVHTSHQLSSYFHFLRIGQKKVVTLHDLNFIHEDVSDKKKTKGIKRIEKNIRNANVIVCISEFAKQDLVNNIHLFNFYKKPVIKVVYNGIKFPDLNKKYSLGDYNFLKDKKYILNIGVLFPKKNQLSLVKMLPFIEEDLVLVYSSEITPYLNEITDEIEVLGLKERVHFCNNITDDEKWALIQNATSMCHPSIAEGFGIPPIEAMGFGKPVFLSDRTSLPEVGGEVAFYFKDFDTQKMVSVYKNGMNAFYENQSEFKDKLIERAAKFDYTVMAKNYLAIYQDLLF
ncbi:glycosyltransferase family 4 protein [Wenyingzhuangia sp. IMCC45467]